MKLITEHRTPFELEDEIEATVNARTVLPRPIYEDDVGKLTADTVRLQYEEAANAITDLGIKASERVNRMDQIRDETNELAKACMDLADRYRAKGAEEAERIETIARNNNEARKVVVALAKKIEQGE